MNNQNIKQVEHRLKPVTIERDVNDVVVIEGVRYSGDFFRMNAVPNEDVLYSIRKHEDVVIVTVVRNMQDANLFFVQRSIGQTYQGQGDPAPTTEGDDDGL